MRPTAIEMRALRAAGARELELPHSERRSAGIVHTPPELARFVARTAHGLLQRELGLAHGIFDPELALIDPACGPGAFLAAIASVAERTGRGPRLLYAADRDPGAIALARRALGSALERAGFRCELVVEDTLATVRPEALAALAPRVCVIGNPPWIAAAQAPPAAWLAHLLDDFRKEPDGSRVRERKLGVLADAYIRFTRVACEVVRRAKGGGVVALVTNASFLDGPVHRALRAALRRFFDRLYVIDLGGNALIARARGQARDENVFGVRPAVAIWFGVRSPRSDERELGEVHYVRRAGTREQKLAWLAETSLEAAGLASLTIDARHQRFVPTAELDRAYMDWPSLAEAMPFHREGVQTNRDELATDVDRERLIARLRAFAAGAQTRELAAGLRRLPHYEPARARAELRKVLARDPDGQRGELVRQLAYRVGELRWFAPIAPLCHRPREALLRAMERSSLALVSVRKDRGERAWNHFAAVEHAIDNCYLSTRSSCRARAFPTHQPDGQENLAERVRERFASAAGRAISSLEFCHYALAVLASPRYRAHYDHALRIDYPRIPPPRDRAQFEAFVDAGRALAASFCRGAVPDEAALASLDRLW